MKRSVRSLRGLTGLGLQPGDRLAVLTLNRVEFFVALLACQRSGFVMAPLNWRQPVPELTEVLSSVGASAVLFDTPNAEAALELATNLALRSISIDAGCGADTSIEELLAVPVAPLRGRSDATAPWYLLFTSGTTGLPKAVIQTARMCWANTLNVAQAIDLTSDDTSVNFLPLFHTAGINLYTLPLFLHGGTSTVLPSSKWRISSHWCGMERSPSFSGFPPSTRHSACTRTSTRSTGAVCAVPVAARPCRKAISSSLPNAVSRSAMVSG